MATKSSTEEVIEKKDASPVTVSCLILAAVALIGALVLVLVEIAEYREGFSTAEAKSENPANRIVGNWVDGLRNDVTTLLANAADGGGGGALDSGIDVDETPGGDE